MLRPMHTVIRERRAKLSGTVPRTAIVASKRSGPGYAGLMLIDLLVTKSLSISAVLSWIIAAVYPGADRVIDPHMITTMGVGIVLEIVV